MNPYARLLLAAFILAGGALIIGWRHFFGAGLGAKCQSTFSCKDALECVDGFCSPSCTNGEACPSGWTCEDVIGQPYRKCRHPK